MDRRRIRRLTGRRLIPRRYWGVVETDDGDGDEFELEIPDDAAEVIIEGACPPSPVASREQESRREARSERPVAAYPPAPTAVPARAEPRRAGPSEARRQHARHLASLYAFGGGIVGAAPIPNPDMPLLISIESRLVADIARMYNPDSAKSAVARAAPLLGLAGYLLRGLSRRGHRRAPLFGWLINGMIAYAGVRLTGEAAVRWCEAQRRLYD